MQTTISSSLRVHAVIIFLFVYTVAVAQKPPVDTSIFRLWPKLGFSAISNDGKFIAYEINNFSFGKGRSKTLILQPRSGNWKMEFATASGKFSFSPDSKTAIIQLSGDSIALVGTRTRSAYYITRVNTYRLASNYLLFTSTNEKEKLHVFNLNNDSVFNIKNVLAYDVLDNGQKLLLNRHDAASNRSELSILEIKSGRQQIWWSGSTIKHLKLSASKEKIAFIEDSLGTKKLWTYTLGDKQMRMVWHGDQAETNDRSLQLTAFSKDEKKIFITASAENINSANNAEQTPGFSVWRYNDANLITEQQLLKKQAPQKIWAVDLDSGKTIPVTQEKEELADHCAGYALVCRRSGTGNIQEAAWNPYSQRSYSLLSLTNGQRTALPMKEVAFSGNGRFLFYYDERTNDYYTREIHGGKTINITARLKTQVKKPSVFYTQEFTTRHNNVYHWMDRDSAVILFGERDIWMVDPNGMKPARNITNGFGATHNIIFFPIIPLSGFRFEKGEKLILTAFNCSTKENGFYSIEWGSQGDPQKLCMDKRVYYMPLVGIENNFDNQPVKAKYANTWLIKSMTESASPNLFTTTDFKKFDRISNIFPEKKYNWLQTELFTWQTAQGHSLQGILYKPENFDPSKKYPIIFHYYEEFADNLHGFLDPRASGGPMNIPWYVSHEYLVFVPDIHFIDGETGANALEAVKTAAGLMAAQPYVDSTRMGIQGHSFGGYETNYIITHSGKFAAACSSSGVSDLVSFSGGISGFGTSMHFMTSEGQIRLGKKLWEDPHRYIRNSPVFFMDRVTTPLLMMHTEGDKIVPLSQALEFFNGLRQCQKKVWMIIYENEDHVLNKESNILDYTFKQFAFFNHFLKGLPEPSWMSPELVR